jgi:integrase
MNIFPWLGDRPVREISSRELLENYRRIENRGALEVAKRVARVCNQIYVYALAAGIVDNNPAAEVSKALKVKPKRNWPAITESKKLQELLQAIDSFDGTLVVQCALRLAPLVFVRPGELRKAEWDEIDLENSLWTIPGRKMKTSREHLVPLSRQSKEILLEIQPLTGKDTYVFPSMRGKSSPMSENALLAALRRLGYSKEEIVPHGFRTTASTLLHEQGWNSRVIETQLAHVDQNKVRGVYNRAEYFEERTRMMQAWADFLDGLKQGTKILAFQQGA